MVVWELFKAELLISTRNNRERWAQGKLQTLWFLFLFFGLVYAFRLVILLGEHNQVDLGLRPEDLLLMALFTFFVKGSADSLHGLIENRYTHFLLAQPVRPGALMIARGVVSSAMNLFFVTVGFLAFLVIDLVSPEPVRGVMPWLGYYELLAVAVLGTLCGVGLTVETHRRPTRKRISGLLFSAPLSAGFALLTQGTLGLFHILAFAGLSVLTIILLRLRGDILIEVIGVQERERSSKRVPSFPRAFGSSYSLLPRAFLQFEWIKYWRQRHHWVAAITLAVLFVIGYYFREGILPLVREIGFFMNARFTPYLEVIFLFFLCYLATMLLGAVPAMESLLGEQRTLYLFRASPAPLRHLTFAKGWHLSPNLTLVALALPLPVGLMLHLSPARLGFALGASIGLFALSVGLGLVLGTVFIRTTSEEEEAGVVPLYSLLMTCLLVGGMGVSAVGGVFLNLGHLAGWAALAAFVCVAFLFLRWSAGWSARRLAVFEPQGAV